MKVRAIFASAIAVAAMTVMSACSDEPEFNKENPMLPEASYNPDVFAAMVKDNNPTVLVNQGNSVLLEKQGSKWKVDQNSGIPICGGSSYAPSKIVLMNGKVYSPLVTFSSVSGPTRISVMIGALGLDGRIDKRREVIVSRDFSLENSRMVINGYAQMITNIKNDIINISVPHIRPTDDLSAAMNCSLFTFVKQDDKTEYYAFDSVEEVYEWALEIFRKRFGEETYTFVSIMGMTSSTPHLITTAEVEQELAEWQEDNKVYIN